MAFQYTKYIFTQLFGDFNREELKKFLLLGVVLGHIIGIYAALAIVRDVLFKDIVGGEFIQRAQIISLISMIPLVLIYSKLVEKLSREALFSVLSIVYGFTSLVIAGLVFYLPRDFANGQADPSHMLGWVLYVFIQSFGSLFVALFWAFATDSTTPKSAEKGFLVVLMVGVLGRTFVPLLVTNLSLRFGMHFNVISNAWIFIFSGLLMFLIVPLVRVLKARVSPEQMIGFTEKRADTPAGEPGIFKGLTLILTQPYLIGILGIFFFQGLIGTELSSYFRTLARTQFPAPFERISYIGSYAFYVNIGIFLCFLFGIIILRRWRAVPALLVFMPLLFGLVALAFKYHAQTNLLFWLMVLSQAIAQMLYRSALRQLYVPTSSDVHFKSQAWIEVFGPGLAGLSSLNNSSFLLGGSILLWIVVALYVGKTYKKSVDSNTVVC
ncbi:MFS transporter [Candidatus Dependentiae bacterium]|nr:MFS transporter [Candidatus Dependentiae bacterium]